MLHMINFHIKKKNRALIFAPLLEYKVSRNSSYWAAGVWETGNRMQTAEGWRDSDRDETGTKGD